jgi:hypothetical protein
LLNVEGTYRYGGPRLLIMVRCEKHMFSGELLGKLASIFKNKFFSQQKKEI